jgi:hypothetical protein
MQLLGVGSRASRAEFIGLGPLSAPTKALQRQRRARSANEAADWRERTDEGGWGGLLSPDERAWRPHLPVIGGGWGQAGCGGGVLMLHAKAVGRRKWGRPRRRRRDVIAAASAAAASFALRTLVVAGG